MPPIFTKCKLNCSKQQHVRKIKYPTIRENLWPSFGLLSRIHWRYGKQCREWVPHLACLPFAGAPHTTKFTVRAPSSTSDLGGRFQTWLICNLEFTVLGWRSVIVVKWFGRMAWRREWDRCIYIQKLQAFWVPHGMWIDKIVQM